MKKSSTKTANNITKSNGILESKKPKKSKRTPNVTLGNDLILKIFMQLDHPDLIRMSILSKYWRKCIIDLELTSLRIAYCYTITNDHLKTVLTRYSKIQKLSLINCPQLSNKCGKHINELKELTDLEIIQCDVTSGLSKTLMPSFMEKLERVQFSYVPVHEKLFSSYQPLQHLKELDLSNNTTITDKIIKVLELNMPNIETLNLSSSSISEPVIEGLVNIRSLKRLSLSFLTRISGKAYASLAKLDPTTNKPLLNKLKRLNISGTSITNDSLKQISKTMTHLKELNLGWCPEITDKGTLYFPMLKRLEILTLEYTLIDMGTFNAFEKMKSLKHISLLGCAHVKKSARAEYAEKHPYFRIINQFNEYL